MRNLQDVTSHAGRFAGLDMFLVNRHSAARRLVAFLESRPSWQWAAFFLCCVLPAVACARWKPITSDEQFTFEIARQSGMTGVWRALLAGADFHPPLDFLLRHLSMRLFGQGEVAFRLPSIIAMWIALLCIYSFVARRTSTLYGVIAALIPLSTPVFEFAYDGRPYAPMVAFASGALLFWQRRTDRSRVALVLLPVALAALVWSHYYGILMFLPLGVAELVRTWNRRRVDWGLWASLAAACAALLPLLPFILNARRFGGTYWTKAGVLQAISIYSTLMERLCIAAAIVLVALLATGLSARARGAERRARPQEVAAVVGIVLLPFVAWLLAKFTGALVTRYVLVTAIGIAIALAFVAWERLGASAGAGLVLAATLAVSGLGGEAAFAWKQRQLRRELERDNLAEIVRGLPGPIVMTDNDLLMQLWHYLPSEVAARLHFLIDTKAAIEIQRYDTIERLFPRLAPYSERLRVQAYADFVRSHDRFLLIDDLRGYLAQLLWRDGATLTAVTSYRGKWVFQVDMKPAPVN